MGVFFFLERDETLPVEQSTATKLVLFFFRRKVYRGEIMSRDERERFNGGVEIEVYLLGICRINNKRLFEILDEISSPRLR